MVRIASCITQKVYVGCTWDYLSQLNKAASRSDRDKRKAVPLQQRLPFVVVLLLLERRVVRLEEEKYQGAEKQEWVEVHVEMRDNTGTWKITWD